MILESGPVVSSERIADLGTVLVVSAPGIAARAHAGQFVHVRPGERFDPLLRRPYSFNGIDRFGPQWSLHPVVSRGHAMWADPSWQFPQAPPVPLSRAPPKHNW